MAASGKEKDDVAPGSVNDSINLNEVVVTGQGAQIQRRRLSSTFTKVQAKDLANVPSGRLDLMLQDALPAVQFSVTTAQPGSTSLIRSRGLSSAFANSTPVIYVDGVRMDNMNTGSYVSASHHGYSAEPYSTSDLPMGQTAATGSIGDLPLENIDHIEYVPGGAATTLYGSDAAGAIQVLYANGGDGLPTPSSPHSSGPRRSSIISSVPGVTQPDWSGTTTNFDEVTELRLQSLGANMGQNTGTVIHDNNDSKRYVLRFFAWLKVN